MAEHSFLEVVKQWNRLCISRYRACNSAANGECPLCSICNRRMRQTMDSAIAVERTIMDWAEKHPEPIYPTWGEWLTSITNQMVDGDLLDSPIPADTAQRIGVKPII